MVASRLDLSMNNGRSRHNETKFIILRTLHQYPRGLTAKQLSIITKRNPDTCKSMLSRYGYFNYVFAKRNPENMKEYIYFLTPQGSRVLNYLQSIHRKNVKIVEMRREGLPAMGGEIASLRLDKHRPDYWKRTHERNEESSILTPERIMELEQKFRNIIS